MGKGRHGSFTAFTYLEIAQNQIIIGDNVFRRSFDVLSYKGPICRRHKVPLASEPKSSLILHPTAASNPRKLWSLLRSPHCTLEWSSASMSHYRICSVIHTGSVSRTASHPPVLLRSVQIDQVRSLRSVTHVDRSNVNR